MTSEEKEWLLVDLNSGQQALRDAVSGFDEHDARIRPAADKWSALECVEHLAVSEEYLLSTILEAQPEGSTRIGRAREHLIAAVGLDRTRPVAAPEPGQPKGRFGTLAEAVSYFEEARRRTLAFVQSCDEDLRSRFTIHPIAGNVNCWEVLLILAVHPRRHAEQIREIAKWLGRET